MSYSSHGSHGSCLWSSSTKHPVHSLYMDVVPEMPLGGRNTFLFEAEGR